MQKAQRAVRQEEGWDKDEQKLRRVVQFTIDYCQGNTSLIQSTIGLSIKLKCTMNASKLELIHSALGFIVIELLSKVGQHLVPKIFLKAAFLSTTY